MQINTSDLSFACQMTKVRNDCLYLGMYVQRPLYVLCGVCFSYQLYKCVVQ